MSAAMGIFSLRPSPWSPPGRRVRPELDVHLVPIDVAPAIAFVRRAVAVHLRAPHGLTDLHLHMGGERCDALSEHLCAVAHSSPAFQALVDSWVHALKLPARMLVQERVNLRVMPPTGAHALGWHKDAALGHAERQWTLWLPIAGVCERNTVGFKTGAVEVPVAPGVGEAILFSAHQVHRTWRRDAQETRVSIDLRILDPGPLDQLEPTVPWRPRFRLQRQGTTSTGRTPGA